jgi:hypothetical protein
MSFSDLTIVFAARHADRRVYLQAKWLQKHFSDAEIIVVAGYNSYSHRISGLIQDDSKGVYSAYNLGISKATRKYILFLGQEDYVSHKGREELRELLKNVNPETSCITFGSTWYQGRKIMDIGKVRADGDWSINGLLRGMPVSHQSLIVSRDAIAAFGGFDENLKIAADYKLVCQLIQAGFKALHSPTIFSIVDNTGLSSHNPELVISEYVQVLSEIFPNTPLEKITQYFLATNHWAKAPAGEDFDHKLNHLMLTIHKKTDSVTPREKCIIIRNHVILL